MTQPSMISAVSLFSWTDTLTIALPVLLGLVVWFVQSLAQRSWDHYEQKRKAYAEIVRLLDSLFDGGDKSERTEYMRAVRTVWLIGSDDVVKAIGALHEDIKFSTADGDRSHKYSNVIKIMRDDLHRRHFLPQKRPA